MARIKRAGLVAEPAATERVGPSIDDKLVAIAETIELIVSGQYGPEYMRTAAKNLVIALKGK